MEAPDTQQFERYPLELIDRCYSLWEMAEFSGLPPHPFEVMAYPSDFLDLLFKYHTGIQFFDDYARRPGYLK